MQAFEAMMQLQQATLAARLRLNDKTIGTRVHSGTVQVIRVTYNARGISTVTPVSAYLPVAGAVAFLDQMGA